MMWTKLTMKSLLYPILITLFIASGCATAKTSELYRIRLYFGLSMPNGGGVSLKEWQAFEQQEIAKTFDGFNVVDSLGYYKGEPERSKILTLILKPDEMPKVKQLAASYAKQFHQDSVMMVKVTADDWQFISGDDLNSELVTPPSTAKPNIQSFSAQQAIDLTHVLHNDMAFWPGGVPFKKETLVTYENGGYLLHKFEMGENTGTHVDAPAHFIKGKLTIDQLTLSQLVLPTVVIDITSKSATNPDYQLSQQDILDWENKYGTIPADCLVILNTGWHAKFNSPKQYVNMDESKVMHFPGFSAEAASLLVERHVAGIGIDTLSIDYGPSPDFSAHKVMLNANNLQIENLANLDELPATGATTVIGVLPVKGGSQAQARVISFVP